MALGVVAHLARVEDAHTDTGLLQGEDQLAVVGAGGLADDAKGTPGLSNPVSQKAETFGVIGELTVGFAEAAIEGGLGDIDSKMVKRFGHD